MKNQRFREAEIEKQDINSFLQRWKNRQTRKIKFDQGKNRTWQLSNGQTYFSGTVFNQHNIEP